MTANELRIGNYVTKSLRSGNGRKIDSLIGCEDIVRIHNFYNSSIYIYEPIPITEEWLMKFGATKYNGNRFYLDLETKGVLQLFWNIGDDYFICEFNSCPNHICYFNDHKYVHQLQNLYFALTQKELEINP
jgi:hypothetical protein